MFDMDPEIDGFISLADFVDIIQRIAAVDRAAIEQLVSSYDPGGEGQFNYFTLLSDLCNQLASANDAARRPPAGRDDADVDDGPRGGGGRRPEQASPRQGSGRQPAGAPAGPKPARGDQIIRHIAVKMNDVFESSQACFHKWRGGSSVIGPEEFMAGARQDFKMDVTLADAREIVGRLGGKLNLAAFLRLLAAGSDSATGGGRVKTQQIDMSRLDEHDQTILHMARQAKDPRWFDIIQRGENPEIMVQNLKKIGIFVLPENFRPAYIVKGKEGFLARLQAFVDALA
jgi:hypothetical protein